MDRKSITDLMTNSFEYVNDKNTVIDLFLNVYIWYRSYIFRFIVVINVYLFCSRTVFKIFNLFFIPFTSKIFQVVSVTTSVCVSVSEGGGFISCANLFVDSHNIESIVGHR
jgi:hypothetical protein